LALSSLGAVIRRKAIQSFQTYVGYSTGNGPEGVAVGDLSRDAAADLVTANVLVNTVSVLLNAAGTFLATTSSNRPSKSGQPVTFIATVAASLQGDGLPTAKVTFRDGAVVLGSRSLVGGQASLTPSSLSVGIHWIAARYSGDVAPSIRPRLRRFTKSLKPGAPTLPLEGESSSSFFRYSFYSHYFGE